MTTLDIQRDVPLAPFTTLELGGPAKYFVRAEEEAMLADALRWADDEGVPAAILAGGSNLIVPDEGFHGLVIQMGIGDLEFHNGGAVHAGAGVPWETVVNEAVSRGWAGLECLTGIPGSTGATPIQNVGAYGQEVAEVVMAQPGVDICAIYGVDVPDTEGRAGMAALVLESGAIIDGDTLYQAFETALPAYARPAFIRVQDAPELTATFKLRKVELQKQGFDPKATSDQIFYRDDASSQYRLLDAETFALIERGEVRF